MSERSTKPESTVATKLRIYQRSLGHTDATLEQAVAGLVLEELRRDPLEERHLHQLASIASVMGIATGDLVPDPLDPADLDPSFAGLSRRETQELHEMAVATSLARALRTKGLRIHGMRRGDAALHEPDAVVSFSILGSLDEFGIEVTCVGYYERGTPDADAYAREVWEAASATSEESEDLIQLGPEMTNFDDVRNYTQSLLEQKCGKTYTRATILVIDASMSHLRLTSAEEGLRLVRALVVPAVCRFARVYLRMTWNMTGEMEYFSVA